jgi:type IX secretion system PorP/SprF family membrane protein
MPRLIKFHIPVKFLFIIATIITGLCINSLYAQQSPQFSQYTMNEFLINPAVAGVDGRTILSMTARKDWVGFSDGINTPQTYAISFQSRILKSQYNISSNKGGGNKLKKQSKGRVGLGASLYTDVNGAIRRTGMQFTYTYHIYSQNSQFSMGLTGSVIQLRFQTNELTFRNNDNEIMLVVADDPAWMPDFGFGINYMTHEFHFGASVEQILETPYILGNSNIDYSTTNLGQKRHYFFIGAMRKSFTGNAKWEYEPSFLLRLYDLFDFSSGYYFPGSQLDISMKLFYDRKYWFGASYRTKFDFVVMGGLKYKKIYFTYSFDYGTNEILKSSYGSHEISISTKFGDSQRRYRWMERY